MPALGPRGEGWVGAQLALIALIGMAGVLVVAGPSGLPALPQVACGAIGIVAGGAVAIRGVRDLGSDLTLFPRPRVGATLVESGAYRYARHPIYSGIVLAGMGWALVAGSVPALLLTAVLLVLFDAKSRREEALLEDQLPDYGAYRRRTRRFVPGIY
jgi:protein-S-isoprenylcysteine O-methyltransferase Ste14